MWWCEDMNFIFEWWKHILWTSAASIWKMFCFPRENKIHIFKPPCNLWTRVFLHKQQCTLVKMAPGSWRDLGKIPERFPPGSRRDFGRRDSRFPPGFLPGFLAGGGIPGGQNLGRIPAGILPGFLAGGGIPGGQNLGGIPAGILPGFLAGDGSPSGQNLGGIPAGTLPGFLAGSGILAAKISAGFRRESCQDSWWEMGFSVAKISAGSRREVLPGFLAGNWISRWECCRDLRRETKFLAVKIFPAAKISGGPCLESCQDSQWERN